MAKCIRCGREFNVDDKQKNQLNVKCPDCKKKIAAKLAGKSGRVS